MGLAPAKRVGQLLNDVSPTHSIMGVGETSFNSCPTLLAGARPLTQLRIVSSYLLEVLSYGFLTESSRVLSVPMNGSHMGHSRGSAATVYCTYGRVNIVIFIQWKRIKWP